MGSVPLQKPRVPMDFGASWGRKINDLRKDGQSSGPCLDVTDMNVIFPWGKHTPSLCVPSCSINMKVLFISKLY